MGSLKMENSEIGLLFKNLCGHVLIKKMAIMEHKVPQKIAPCEN